jgi:hypothetical protein
LRCFTLNIIHLAQAHSSRVEGWSDLG